MPANTTDVSHLAEIYEALDEDDRKEFAEGLVARLSAAGGLAIAYRMLDDYITDWYFTAVVTSSPEWQWQMADQVP